MYNKYRRSRPRKITPFAAAIDFSIAARDYDCKSLIQAINGTGNLRGVGALLGWRNGRSLPRNRERNRLLKKIETLLRLRENYFSSLIAVSQLPHQVVQRKVAPSLHWVVQWHLPDDFDQRSVTQQKAISDWLSDNVLDGVTDFGKYVSKRAGSAYCVVFPKLAAQLGARRPKGRLIEKADAIGNQGSFGTIPAPPRLAGEMSDMVVFKTAPLPPPGYRR